MIDSPASIERPTARERWLKDLERLAAPVMFAASLVFLILLAGAIQAIRRPTIMPDAAWLFGWAMLCLYPLFWLELLIHLLLGDCWWRQHVLFALAPPFRLGGRGHETGNRVWLPRLGWLPVGRDSARRVETIFSGPMLVIALAVLPLLGLEYYWAQQVARSGLLSFALDTATSIIWLAFTLEFIVMVSLVDHKARYARQHWIDLVVILLPLLAFVRALRVAQLVRLQQLGRLTRTYHLRGLATRAYRGLLALNVLRHIVRVPPEKRLTALRELLAEKEYEAGLLRDQIREVEIQIAARQQAAAQVTGDE